MDLLSRYRNITVLLVVIFAQLVLLGYQVKSNQDVRLIRVWAVTGVTPMAKAIDSVRSATVSSVGNYVNLHNLTDENKQLKAELGKLKLENQFLNTELQRADRAVALTAFQSHNPSKMLAGRVIATGTGGGATSRVVFIDRGSAANLMRGMAVITPDGIVGKVLAAYPTASQVLLITDPTFAAGVISQRHHVRGTVRGLGHSTCQVDYIQNEEVVDPGERFFTSGDDGVFPKGLPVGSVTVAKPGNPNKQVFLTPSGLQGGLEEVLIIVEGVHQPIPDPATASADVHLQTPAPEEEAAGPKNAAGEPVLTTEADRMRARYQKIGEAQGHTFGSNPPGTKPVDLNMSPEEAAARAAARAAAGQGASAAGAPAQPGANAAAPREPQTRPQTANPGGAATGRTPESPAGQAPRPQTSPTVRPPATGENPAGVPVPRTPRPQAANPSGGPATGRTPESPAGQPARPQTNPTVRPPATGDNPTGAPAPRRTPAAPSGQSGEGAPQARPPAQTARPPASTAKPATAAPATNP